MAEKKKRAPLPPSQPVHGTQTGGSHTSVREINNPAYVEVDGSQQSKKMSLPLPDYETLFPQKRHGVQGHTRWDHIIAEVNQRHRDVPPELLGPEMSVDDPVEHRPSLRSSLPQESPVLRYYQTHPQETKPVSSKKVAAPAPPKPATPPYTRPIADSGQRQNQNITHRSAMMPNPSLVPGPVNTDAPSRESLLVRPGDGTRKALHPSPAPRPASQMEWNTTTPDDQRSVQVSMNKEAPKAKPRQRASGIEPAQQEDSAVTPDDQHGNRNIQTSSSTSRMDKKGRQTQENFAGFDPFPSSELLSKDPWAQLKQNQEVDNLFTGSVQKEQKLEDRGMTADDLSNIFSQEKPTDPFAIFNGSESNKHSEHRKKEEDSEQVSPAFQRRNSSRRSRAPPSTTHSDSKTFKSQQEPAYKEETAITTADQGLPAREVTNEPATPKLQADVKTQSRLYGGEDPFGAQPFTVTSALTSSEPLQVVTEEPEPQTGSLSGGKKHFRAWVSPSEVQPVSAQNSNGGGLALTPRRPHPVKPMSSAESQHPINTPAVKEIRVRDSTPGKIQVADSVESGPYTQLTQEELITLVVKQQTDLSRKDAKIVELEEYIDNLLVRVIDEKPSILYSLNSSKPV